MAFSDPQSVTISAVAIPLPRISSGTNSGGFQSNDGNTQISISHTYGKRTRRVLKLTTSKIAADPLISSTNIKYSMSTYLVVDTPVTGYTVTEAKQVIDALVAYLAASTGAKVTQLLGGEN
ncbi:coat protein [ssRNA phage Gephyllon.1_8]|uniref:Coat protein n=2 Tax=Leviviricetes TaxID=2842243 RepID=A0A8S5L2V1_9VIRU|nr:coat protein [ssRNA phage Gephyllon.1_8]QDH86485.1 MAG: hypothetical protein H1BulkLitter4279_000002 [Leviviridae sp.]DAD52134.1 TPA_asm: coat protein [ssRNA phage Gephyllon.1_8]